MRYLYSLNQKIIEHIYKKKVDNGYIYMFHQINDNKSKWFDRSVSITVKGFETFLNRLQDNGAKFLDISNVGISHDPKSVYITFDDVFSDFYNYGLAIMEKRNIPYCCFIAIDLIDRHYYVSKEMVLNLANKRLCTIGAHSFSHPNLRQQNDNTAMKEIIGAKAVLEDIIKLPINYYAYPYGSLQACSKRDIKLAQKAGYKMAFSTFSMGLSKRYIQDNRWFLPRININEDNYIIIGDHLCSPK